LNETNQKVQDLENKIQKEIQKIHNFTKEIIKINIQINHRQEVENDIQKDIQKHKDELEELKKNI
jgi:chromosome segregation ATPase